MHLARVDSQLFDLDRVAPLLGLGPDAAPRRRLHAGDELLHRERLDQVVVGPDLQRVHAVMLGAAGADDDDGRPDALRTRGLDQLPAVEAGQHQVEHDDVRELVPEPREPDLSPAHRDRLEAGAGEVLCHAGGNDLVVLDDQHLRHRA